MQHYEPKKTTTKSNAQQHKNNLYGKQNNSKPCGSVFFPELSFPEPSVGKSPEVRENPSFLDSAAPCNYKTVDNKIYHQDI